MAIQKIQIWGYRSISYMELQAGQIVAFIGQNGSGKSNILSALHFFYCNLTRTWEEKGNYVWRYDMGGNRARNYWSREMEVLLTAYRQFETLIPAPKGEGAAHRGEDGVKLFL